VHAAMHVCGAFVWTFVWVCACVSRRALLSPQHDAVVDASRDSMMQLLMHHELFPARSELADTRKVGSTAELLQRWPC